MQAKETVRKINPRTTSVDLIKAMQEFVLSTLILENYNFFLLLFRHQFYFNFKNCFKELFSILLLKCNIQCNYVFLLFLFSIILLRQRSVMIIYF